MSFSRLSVGLLECPFHSSFELYCPAWMFFGPRFDVDVGEGDFFNLIFDGREDILRAESFSRFACQRILAFSPDHPTTSKGQGTSDTLAEWRWTVSRRSNLVILHPDELLSATTIGSSLPCLRRSLLGLHLSSGPSKAGLLGSMAHELFQTALSRTRLQLEWTGSSREERRPPKRLDYGQVRPEILASFLSSGFLSFLFPRLSVVAIRTGHRFPGAFFQDHHRLPSRVAIHLWGDERRSSGAYAHYILSGPLLGICFPPLAVSRRFSPSWIQSGERILLWTPFDCPASLVSLPSGSAEAVVSLPLCRPPLYQSRESPSHCRDARPRVNWIGREGAMRCESSDYRNAVQYCPCLSSVTCVQLITVRVDCALGVEENIWSHTFGLKGKLVSSISSCPLLLGSASHPSMRVGTLQDASLSVYGSETFKAPGLTRSFAEGVDPPKLLLLPLELKTGKSQHFSHKGQLLLYTILMSDRYDTPVRDGLLLYLHHQEMVSRYDIFSSSLNPPSGIPVHVLCGLLCAPDWDSSHSE